MRRGTKTAKTIESNWSRIALNPIRLREDGFTAAGVPVSRETTLTYNGKGQVTAIDGPRTDTADLTTFTYYDCTTGGQCGQLATTSNALGHVSSFDSYNAHGQLTQRTDPNGVVATFGYDSRQRLISI